MCSKRFVLSKAQETLVISQLITVLLSQAEIQIMAFQKGQPHFVSIMGKGHENNIKRLIHT